MDIWTSFLICISMYSIIPVPRIDWTEKRMRYCFCFFPLIGIIIGGIWYGCYQVLEPCTENLKSIVLLLIPIVISGGIHLDGWIDTCDAIFSYGDRDKKLEILKDPRTGAFGVIGAIVYFLLLFAAYSQILENKVGWEQIPVIFVMSRAAGSFCMITMKNAKKTGLGASFSNASSERVTQIVLLLWMMVAGYFMPMVLLGILVFVVVVYLWYINREFQGITGDLTGFLIMLIELVLLWGIAVGGVA